VQSFPRTHKKVCRAVGVSEPALPVLHRYGFSDGVFVTTGKMDVGPSGRHDARAAATHMSVTEIRQWSPLGVEFGTRSLSHVELTDPQETSLKRK